METLSKFATCLLIFLFEFCCSNCNAVAQTSDTLIVNSMKQEGVTFTNDNTITLLPTGQQKFDDMFQAIRQARHSVHLEYFNFRNDSIASMLFDILAEKVKEGVEVRALYDAFGNSSNNQPLKKQHINDLRCRGIQIYEFDPIRFPWINHIYGRDHRKIVVIDGQIAYTGGMNVADYYIKGTPVVGAWRDMHCRLEGSEVASLQQIFVHAWKKVTGEQISGIEYYPGGLPSYHYEGLAHTATPTDGNMKVGVANREPHKTQRVVREFYLNAINHAQDTIRLINPYFTLSRPLKRALKNAVKRGVVVQIMVAAPSDIPITPDCVFWNVNMLQKKGCDVWIYEPGFHHTKVIMVDGRFCTVGSTNLDSRSLRCDYEENLIIIDKNITRQLSNMFDKDKHDSFKLNNKTWKEWRTKGQRMRAWFAHLLYPFL